MEPEELEQILQELLLPDTERIRRATEELQIALRHPGALPALCELLAQAPDPQIRQFSALLIRRRVSTRWRRLAVSNRQSLKSLVLKALEDEADHSVTLSLAQLSATILRNEGLDAWPQLMHLLQHSTQSFHIPEKEMGLLLLSVVVTSRPEAFQPHHRELLNLLDETLGESTSAWLLYYSLRTLTTLAPYLGPNALPQARSLVPKVLLALQTLIQLDETKACEALEALDELLESELPIITPYLSEVLTFCLEVAKTVTLGDAVRVRVLCCVSFLVKLKSKALLKNRLLGAIFRTLFPIMTAEPPPGHLDPEDQDTDEEELEGGLEVEAPKQFAVQVIDVLALHLAPEKLFPQLMPLLEEALYGENPYQRKAGLLVLAVLSDGAGDYIRQRMLTPLMQVVCKGLADSSQVVRNAALFAMGQFSENLQPNISTYSGDVMPLLLAYLRSVPPGNIRHLAKACYALENFVESLGQEVETYLQELMERMLQPLREATNPRAKELAVSAIGAIASAAQSSLIPYFPTIMEHLREFLVTGREDLRPVQIQSLETLGVLARAVEEPMKPLAEECCLLGLSLCKQVDDPDLRRCTYSLFAALSRLMGEGMAPHLPKIITFMMSSLRSTEGIVPVCDTSNTFLLFDESEDEDCEGEMMEEDNEEEEDSDISGYNVENAFFDEKEDTCLALGEISVNVSMAFFPFIERFFEEVYKLSECPHINVRKAAYETLGQFCCSLHKVSQTVPSEQNSFALQTALGQVVPSFLQAVNEDRERLVVMSVLEALTSLLRNCGPFVLQPPRRLAELCNVVKAVLQKKIACQDPEEDEEDEMEQAEYDAMLLEHAGEVIPALASAAGGETFAPFFVGFLPLLLRKAKPGGSVAEKSFAVGTLAEVVQGLGAFSAQFVSRLMPVLLSAARDSDAEVRSNAVFGLGVLMEHGGRPALEHFQKILGFLSNLIARERQNRVRDNICGAFARLLMANPRKPQKQVLTTLFRALPLTEDLEEWVTMGKFFNFLYQSFPEQVADVAPEILNICTLTLSSSKVPQDTKAALLLLLTHLAQQHTDRFQAALGSLPPGKAQELQAMLSPT
ncbi:importin-4 isoform X2 [Dromiciops gliroides]|uniref:importin-4 isoform X2 n=1 Tax=Dromiciops gliroides TaxID=33562 RepID=UPI001CC44E65|nr:importin-4 isoform X2 [Dromiciops gliroides]